ncbi:TVP38/TMEM64 family inner membrane protein YdjZ [Oxobacter pfennigii]|uniref:TVP38/TMEM64 family inner membrane protein YdjZ n=1 Tax=Oxobacter pfennigii TaxID=36849 RepID=A0A0P8W5D6_9CLOT|nr:DedA family protein [Oxobacter pfennigii]KPU42825.1 TVP38/TMEM64 family inner membrane protein YdjZ [Oxobacter pfennigii]
MQEIILDIINQFGYIGVFLLITIENIFPPIPSEVILTFGGFLTTYTNMNVWGVIISATIGSVAGAIILYIIGRILSAERLARLIDSRLGKLLRLKKEDVRKAERWFSKHGNKAVFFCRFVPIVRSLISIPAGVAKMQLCPFFSLTVIGTFIWNVVLVFLGRIAGNAWETIVGYVDIYAMITLTVFMLTAMVVGTLFIKKRFLNTSKLQGDK